MKKLAWVTSNRGMGPPHTLRMELVTATMDYWHLDEQTFMRYRAAQTIANAINAECAARARNAKGKKAEGAKS